MCLLQVRDLWEEYYSGADAIVFMVDSSDHERFEEVRDGWFGIAVFYGVLVSRRTGSPYQFLSTFSAHLLSFYCLSLYAPQARNEMQQILACEDLTDVPVLVLANKSDLEHSAGKEKMTQELGLKDADENRDISVFSCSLVRGVGYVEGFRWLSARL